MTGGLINIVSYVSNDLYLTGSPQITFYKMVYRRYTNFAMESVYLDFDDDIKFGYESELVPPRIADLLHKSYLHIKIPNISITKHDVGIDTSNLTYAYSNNNIFDDYQKVKTVYMKNMVKIYQIIFKAVNAINVTYSGLVQDVHEYVQSDNVFDLLNQYDELLKITQHQLIANNDPNRDILDCTRSNLWTVLTSVNINKLIEDSKKTIDVNEYEEQSDDYIKEHHKIMKNSVFGEIQKGLDRCIQVQQFFFEESKNLSNQIEEDKNNNIKCAWVKNLGHSIIEYIDVYIGGKRIDRHLGIWINIWYQLTYKEPQIKIYNEMIGNVDELTNFDNREKPAYDLYIPMTFWFNKFNGLSFPLIAMQYNDLRFNVKLRKFEEVFYIERVYRTSFHGTETVLTASLIDFITNRSKNADASALTHIELVQDIVLTDIWEEKGKRLNAHIIMDYIYLESAERKRFAQSGHEYLIERMQIDTFDHIRQKDLDVQLDFTNPSKELIWVMMKDAYTENDYGWNECKWDNYTIGTEGKNPVIDCSMSFNTYTRVQKQVGRYFDTYQPLIYHKVSPSSGINIYSFCTDPLQQQPTGSCNFSRLIDAKLFLTIDPRIYRYTDAELYPYDTDLDFAIELENNQDFLNTIDHDFMSHELSLLENIEKITPSQLLYKNKLTEALEIYDELEQGNVSSISMRVLRLYYFQTTSKFHVFNLTMNILRLIGGYGALAYSGNN